jgi:hypothetical protein
MSEENPQRAGEWRAPLTLAAAGLGLLLGGYFLMTYTPPPPRDPEKARLLEVVREAAQDPEQAEFRARLRQWDHPYRPAGTVAFYAGLLLLAAAAVRMYRHQPAPEAGPAEDADPGQEPS